MSLRLIILFVAILSTSLGVGQSKVVTRQNSGEPLVEKFITSRDQYLQEKIFIHTDRNFYLTGETCWFKLYCIDGSFHHPALISKVAYIELIDENKKSVIQTKLAMSENGHGNGSVFLPASLSSGNYVLRAYTNWMKNVSPDLYFHQGITVVNPFINPSLSSGHNNLTHDFQFFPEGGNMVFGLQSVVGFRGVDQGGSGANFHGIVVNEQNDTIARIMPLKFGIGKFVFTPLKGQVYRAIINYSDHKTSTYQLPGAHEDGIVLNLSEEDDRVNVTVRGTMKTNLQDPAVYLLAHTRQKNLIYDKQFLKHGEAVFTISKNLLEEGVTHLTIFNDALVPVCERLFFKKPTQKINVEIQPGSFIYDVRKKVDLEILTKLPGGNTVASGLSVSVFKMDSLNEDNQTIVDYLLLSSDLKGNIESPSYYLENENTAERKEASDNLMLTHGWSRFKWGNILSQAPRMEYAPEYAGHFISGQVKDSSTKNPVAGVVAFLSSPGFHTRPYLSTSDEHGNVFFEVRNFYGNSELIVQTNTRIDSTCTIEIFNPFSQKHSSYTLPEFNLAEKSKYSIAQRSLHMQVQNIFRGNERTLFKRPAYDSSSFYGTPDEEYRLDAYTRFLTMEEVMREYVQGVNVRKRRDGYHFYNLDYGNKETFQNHPLVLIDGVPVFDIDEIISFDPRKVNTLEVINRKYFLAGSSFDGVVSYKTYQGDLGGFPLDTRSLILNYDGLQLQREFFSPRYETQKQVSTTNPDTRNLLFWSPNLQTDGEGKAHLDFYTSDITGKYKVVIQCITREGIPGFSSIAFEVKSNSAN